MADERRADSGVLSHAVLRACVRASESQVATARAACYWYSSSFPCPSHFHKGVRAREAGTCLFCPQGGTRAPATPGLTALRPELRLGTGSEAGAHTHTQRQGVLPHGFPAAFQEPLSSSLHALQRELFWGGSGWNCGSPAPSYLPTRSRGWTLERGCALGKVPVDVRLKGGGSAECVLLLSPAALWDSSS